MDFDFRYQQYQNAGLGSNADNANSQTNKPHQEVIDYFVKNRTNFNFHDFYKVFNTINGDVELFLEDNTRIKVFRSDKIIKVGVKYADGTHFFGSWTCIEDEDEFLNAL